MWMPALLGDLEKYDLTCPQQESPDSPATAEKSTTTDSPETPMQAEKSTTTDTPEPPMRAEKSTATDSPEPPMRAEKSTATQDPALWDTPSCHLELVVGKAPEVSPGKSYKSAPRKYAGHHSWRLAAYPSGSECDTHLSVVVFPNNWQSATRHPELTFARCKVEIINWLDEDKSRCYQLAPKMTLNFFWTTTDLKLDESWQQDGWLGPDGSLWLRATLSPSKQARHEAPALSENEAEFLISEAYESGGKARTFCEVKEAKGLKWKASVAMPPLGALKAALAFSLECLCTDGNDRGWQPPRARYRVKIVNWLAYDQSVDTSGTVDFTKAPNGKADIEVPPPAGGFTRESGWLGPGDAIWLRASLTSVSIKHDFRFMPRDVVLALDAFQCMQELQGAGGLVTKTIELSPATIRKYSEEYCVVSHYWNALAQPDANGAQLAALKRHLVANPCIQFVWFDFCCLPQRDSGTKRRNEAEEEEFRDGLKNVYLLFLNVPVLILYDLHFFNRFWPLWEAWLAMHTPTASGLQLAPAGPQQRWTIIDLKGDGKTEGAGSLLTCWVQKYPDQKMVFEYLSRDDVSVTNNSDKQVQLEVLSNIEEDVQAAME